MSARLLELQRLAARLPRDPSLQELAALEAAFAALGADDVPLAPHLPRLLGPRPGSWWSAPVFEGEHAHLSLFLFPAGQALPLHDHPGMHVWTRVLRGRVALRAFDWVSLDPPRARPAGVLKLDAAAPPWHTEPLEKNLHELSALEPAAVLDLFAPYYDLLGGRPCHYWCPLAREADGTIPLALVREE